MELAIYNRQGTLKKKVSPDSSSRWTEEVGTEFVVTVNFTTWEFFVLSVGDYMEISGKRFSIKKEYRPKKTDTQKYTYNISFYGREHDMQDLLFCRLNQGEDDLESVFAYDGTPMEMLEKLVANMNRNTDGVTWRAGQAVTGDRKTINFNGLFCWDAAGEIAGAWETEWWLDGEYLNIGKCEHGERVTLGYMKGLKTGLTQNENSNSVKWFTRLIPVGSTKNIDPSKYGYTHLQLPSRDKYIDLNTQLGLKEHREEAAFQDIFPHRLGTVSSVRSEEQTNKDGKKYTVYYVKDKDLPFNPDEYMIGSEVIHITFESGDLSGREFECNWHNDTQEVEIINTYPDENTQIPGGNIIPNVGDTYILTNIRMPDEYYPIAEEQYKQAVDSFLTEYSKDISIYSGDTDYIHVDKNSVPLSLGQRVRLEDAQYFEAGYLDTRITRIERKLGNLSEASIDCSSAVSTSWKSSVDSTLNNLEYTLAQEMAQANVRLLKTGDMESPNDYTAFSSLRAIGTFLRKNIADIASEIITFLKGLRVGKFVTGLIGGSGAAIWFDKNGKTIVEADKAMFREELIVPQITFNCIDVISGDKANSFAYGRIKTVDTENRIATLELLEGQWGTLKVSDICRGILHNIAGSNHTQDEYGPNGFMEYSGYATSYFTPTRIIENEAGNMKFEYALQAGTSVHPLPGMNFFAYGNFTDKDRQAITYENRYYTRRLINVNTWVIDPDVNIAYQSGDLSGLTINGQIMDGYSSYQKNVYVSGTIERLKPNGEVAMDLSYEGVWQSDRHYDYYDSVTYNGSTWACLNKNGSSSEPGTDADWQEIASKGDTGAPGKDGVSVTNSGPWYSGLVVPKMSIVTMGGSSFLSKVSTTNPPLWCWTDNAGNRFTFNDGGYCLTGEINTDEYELLVQSGKDGSDGTSYERVFIHTTTESKPATPSTSQTDDYVPSGWHDDPVGVSSSLPYEWISEREKKNGIWSKFSAPALWAKYGFDGADGAEGVAGTSIIWKGDFSSAPSNPQNGWAYKNTTDKKSYVYQDGQWYQMTIDGIDGKNGKDGLSIVWKGDLQTPPSNPQTNWAYRDTNNGRVYIWNGTAWALMVVDGSDGADGAAGSDGLSVFITYNDSTSQPSVPTGNGTTGGWHTNATSAAIWMSQKVAASASDGAWGTPIKIKGDKGDGYTQMGQFRTGMVVPKMGVVSMGGGSYVAKASTTNPPLWCWTDNAGNRFTYNDGGYVLTGEINTDEYELLVQSGKDGSDGTSYERVFIHTTTESKPATPSTSQTDDYVPSGWHDDPVGVSSSLPYEWISEREKKNGIWSKFSAPALWAKYGFDGADGAEGVAGTSIIWKGDFSSAPSNPQNGWAYKNTTDKKSYVYQDGQWYQMTIDGIDGKNGKDGLSIVWKGDLQTPPSNPQTNWAYRDTNNGRVYIWNGTAWALMVVDGSDGADGAAGSDGLSVFITYNDSTSQPSVPTGNGTTGGWHTNATSAAIWMSQKVAASASDGAWGTPIKIKGDKGDGYTQMGQFRTGMVVPKMGVVSMGGGSYVAKASTTNPPLWCWTDNAGNRFTYNDGGYVLTGEVNTAEYDVWAEKGDTGSKGDKGDKGDDGEKGDKGDQGVQGIQGCIFRESEWSASSVQYRNDESLTSGTRYIDFALIRNDAAIDGWDVYKCLKTHVSSASNKPGNTTYWEKLSGVGPIYTSLIIAKNASISLFQGNQVLIKKSDNTVSAGMSGSTSGQKIRIWAGSATPDSAPFRVNEQGGFVATKANVAGTVTATLLYSPGSDMDSLADSEGNMTVNPSTQGSTFFSADGLGGTITLPPASSWNGLKLEFVVDMTSRAAKNPDKYKATNYFCGLAGAYNNKTEIQMARPYVLEMKAFNNHWYITRMDLIE